LHRHSKLDDVKSLIYRQDYLNERTYILDLPILENKGLELASTCEVAGCVFPLGGKLFRYVQEARLV
jgi:hypothetical protein